MPQRHNIPQTTKKQKEIKNKRIQSSIILIIKMSDANFLLKNIQTLSIKEKQFLNLQIKERIKKSVKVNITHQFNGKSLKIRSCHHRLTLLN